MKLPVISTICLAVSASIAFAQAPATNPPAAPGAAPAATGTGISSTAVDKSKALTPSDKALLKKALEGMYFELQLTDKAKREAKLEDTKKASGKINTDLNKVWGELAPIYADGGEKLPTELVGGDKSKAQRLSKAGDKYDKELLEILSKETKSLERNFESGSKSQNAAIKSVCTNWLPTVKGHTDDVEKAEKVAAKSK